MYVQAYYYLKRFVLKHSHSLKTCSCSPSVYNWFKCAKIAHIEFVTINVLYVGKLININFLLNHI